VLRTEGRTGKGRGGLVPQGNSLGSLGRAIVRSKYGVLLVGLMILVVLGLSLLQDYGTSVDEELNAYYGSLTLRAYQTGSLLKSPGIDYFNGTFYFMVFTITSQLFRVLNPGWLATDGRHLTNFLIFLVGVYFFYRISMRLFPRGASLFLCALFASQPVLFGHAFINQKDVPLMVFFLASVELGLTAIDRLRLLPGRPVPGPEPEDPGSVPKEPWRRLLRGLRSTWGLLAACALLLVIDLWFTRFGEQLSKDLVATAYTGGGPDWLARLFASVATDAYKTPLEAYLAKVVQGFLWIRLASLPVVLAMALGLWRASFPENYRRSMDGWVRRWGGLIVGGAVLGMTTSIRILGPFAGLLVAIYAFARAGRRALPALVLYTTVAAVATYMTWPVLWGDPVGVFLDRAGRASSFVRHEVFLLGTEYESNNLPWHYLPTSLACS